MARSLLGSFVGGTRQMLAIQLFVSIGAVALTGWTLGVTNDLIRERNRLRERVIQLEETMAGRGITVPETAPVLERPPSTQAPVYPPTAPEPNATPETPNDTNSPTEAADPGKDPTGAPTGAAPETPPPASAEPRPFDPTQIITGLFAPPPPLRTLVLHVRDRADYESANRIATTLSEARQVRVVVDIMGPGDQRQSGYAYFDGRQSNAAADLVEAFSAIARRNEIAPWSAQLRGVALPAQGEYSSDRVDIVLPPRPAPTPVPLDRLRLEQLQVVRPPPG